jgi:general secretion pathway protein H
MAMRLKGDEEHQRPCVKNGFTLVEAAITLAILAIAASVVIPSMGRITRAELRRVSGQLSGMIRTAYDSAALTGQVHRLKFDFEKSFIVIESTDGDFQIGHVDPEDSSTNLLSRLSIPEPSPDDEDAGAEGETEDELNGFAIGQFLGQMGNAMRSGGGEFSALGKGLTLGDKIEILRIDFAADEAKVEKGEGYIYFFPQGFAQKSTIFLQDVDGRIFTIKISSLTGKPTIFDEYVEKD